eukprot:s78_g34.t1
MDVDGHMGSPMGLSKPCRPVRPGMYRRSIVRNGVQQFQSCFNCGWTTAPFEKRKTRENGKGILIEIGQGG